MNFSGITVKFLSFDTNDDGVYYHVLVTIPNSEPYKVDPVRYSQLRYFHSEISSKYKGDLPSFPPKKWFGNKSNNFLSQRQKSLEHYFNTLMKTVKIDDFPFLVKFLKLGNKGNTKSLKIQKEKIEPAAEKVDEKLAFATGIVSKIEKQLLDTLKTPDSELLHSTNPSINFSLLEMPANHNSFTDSAGKLELLSLVNEREIRIMESIGKWTIDLESKMKRI